MSVWDVLIPIGTILGTLSAAVLAWMRFADIMKRKVAEEHESDKREEARLRINEREQAAKDREELRTSLLQELDRLSAELRDVRKELNAVRQAVLKCEQDKLYMHAQINELRARLRLAPISVDEMTSGAVPLSSTEDSQHGNKT